MRSSNSDWPRIEAGQYNALLGKWQLDLAKRLVRSIARFALLMCAATTTAAPPKVDTVFPAGVARSQTVTVTAAGQFANWPPQVWIDATGVTIVPAEKKGDFQVQAAADADCGVVRFRVYDAEGASELRPLIVGTLDEVLEQESNDAPDAPQAVTAPLTINGRLEKSGDVDAYAVTVEQGQTLVAAIQANQILGSPMDAVLQICDADGFVLEQNDDERGLDPLIAFTAPRNGTYLIRTFAFPTTPNSTIGFAGGANFIYRLTVTTGGFLDHTLPMAAAADGPTELRLFGWNLPAELAAMQISASGSSACVAHSELAEFVRLPVESVTGVVIDKAQAPQPISLPAVVSGRIDDAGDVDEFEFTAKAGQSLTFVIESRSLGYALDPVLRLTDASGKKLAEIDDVSKQADPVLTHKFAADGQYHLSIRDAFGHGGLRFVYRLRIDEPRADFALKLATDHFVVKSGESLEIPITVERQNGFTGQIDIRAVDLPGGVSGDSVSSEAKGDTAKAVKLKLAAGGKAFSGPIRILGTSNDDPPLERTARFPIADSGDESNVLWLTVTAK